MINLENGYQLGFGNDIKDNWDLPVAIHRVGSRLNLLDVKDLQCRLQDRRIYRRLGVKYGRHGVGSELIRHVERGCWFCEELLRAVRYAAL